MIRINLLGNDTVVDHSGKFVLAGIVLSWCVVGVIFFSLNRSLNISIADLTQETETLNRQLVKLRDVTKEVRDLDAKRTELNDKLAVIARLKRNKVGPVRVMDDLNLAIPERAWIADIKESGGNLSLNGFALDDQTTARFIEDLQASDYFENVELVETKQVDKDGAKIKAFILDTRISYAGKIAAAVPAATGK